MRHRYQVPSFMGYFLVRSVCPVASHSVGDLVHRARRADDAYTIRSDRGPAPKCRFRSIRTCCDMAAALALANAGHDTRALQAWLGHKNIQHTVRYTKLAPDRSASSSRTPPWRPRASARSRVGVRSYLEDAADDSAIGEHVVVVVTPLAR